MAVTKKFTQPLQVVETQETRDRIQAIADREGVSQAQVIRELVAKALPWREELSEQRGGPASVLEGLA